jgi:hypothetical protein
MGMGYDKSKFVFSETFNNSDGKTSGSGFIGVIMGLTTVGAFIAGIVGWYLGNALIIEYFDKVLQLGGLSALLMGVRKAVSIFNKNGNGNGYVTTPKPNVTSDTPVEKG